MIDDYLKHLYTENTKLSEYNILHMYPRKLTHSKGVCNHRFFKLVIFNQETMEYRDCGEHHDVIYQDSADIKHIGVYRDKATVIKFNNYLIIQSGYTTQTVFLFERKDK